MAIAEIHVTLKPTLLDAQGATVLKALRQLGHNHVRDVRIGKHIQVEVDDALSGAALQSQLELMCRELLSNPVIEDYSITLGGTTVGASASGAATTSGISSAPVSPLAAAVSAETNAVGVATSDVVPNPQPLRPIAAASPETQPAQVSAPRVSAPQTISAPQSAAEGVSILESSTPSMRPDVASMSTHSLPDPFAADYSTYAAMSADDKIAIQGRAWEQHGAWILSELNTRRAAWILCVGQKVIESGSSVDSYPTDAHMETLGTTHDLVPWVFTRPPQ